MAFWIGAVAALVYSPILASSLLELAMVDPGKCTLDAQACARLTKKGTP